MNKLEKNVKYLSNKGIPIQLKGKLYKTVERPTMIYGSKFLAVD